MAASTGQRTTVRAGEVGRQSRVNVTGEDPDNVFVVMYERGKCVTLRQPEAVHQVMTDRNWRMAHRQERRTCQSSEVCACVVEGFRAELAFVLAVDV